MTGQPMALPPEAQQHLIRMQTYQQTAQSILVQKETMSIQKVEIESALEELGKSEGDVFKAVGPILVKSTKDKLESELKEKLEDIDVKTKSLETQEKKLQEKMLEIQEKLQEMLKPKSEEKASAN